MFILVTDCDFNSYLAYSAPDLHNNKMLIYTNWDNIRTTFLILGWLPFYCQTALTAEASAPLDH